MPRRSVEGHDGKVMIVRATRKLLGLVGPPDLAAEDHDTTRLGPWYATTLLWRPRVALVVSESTLLPVLMPLTAAAGWPSRIAAQITTVLAAHDAPPEFIDAEGQQMHERRLGPTASRRLVGVMNEFARLADIHRHQAGDRNLLELSLRLSTTPCSPLYGRNVSPDRELAAVIRFHG